MNLSDLDRFSRDFAERLFESYPEWQAFAKVDPLPNTVGGCLLVEIPAPAHADWAAPLIIHTGDEEVAFTFDCYHIHLDWPPDSVLEGTLDDPFVFLAATLKEEIAAVSVWEGQTWRGSMIAKRGEEPDLTGWYHPVTRVRIRSWNGALNRDYSIS